jgi:hypothetical protein
METLKQPAKIGFADATMLHHVIKAAPAKGTGFDGAAALLVGAAGGCVIAAGGLGRFAYLQEQKLQLQPRPARSRGAAAAAVLLQILEQRNHLRQLDHQQRLSPVKAGCRQQRPASPACEINEVLHHGLVATGFDAVGDVRSIGEEGTRADLEGGASELELPPPARDEFKTPEPETPPVHPVAAAAQFAAAHHHR